MLTLVTLLNGSLRNERLRPTISTQYLEYKHYTLDGQTLVAEITIESAQHNVEYQVSMRDMVSELQLGIDHQRHR